jgi:hypothetical protein
MACTDSERHSIDMWSNQPAPGCRATVARVPRRRRTRKRRPKSHCWSESPSQGPLRLSSPLSSVWATLSLRRADREPALLPVPAALRPCWAKDATCCHLLPPAASAAGAEAQGWAGRPCGGEDEDSLGSCCPAAEGPRLGRGRRVRASRTEDTAPPAAKGQGRSMGSGRATVRGVATPGALGG